MRRFFTLLELLVAVAVIAILMALLLPALGKARQQANRTVCAGNLKQLGLGFQMYCADYREYFPVSPVAWYGISYAWYLMLSDYVRHMGYGSKQGAYFCSSNPASCVSGGAGYTNYESNFHFPGNRIIAVRDKKLLLMDALSASGSTGFTFDRWAPWFNAWPVHFSGVNTVFVDGHGEWMTTLPTPTTAGIAAILITHGCGRSHERISHQNRTG